MGDKILRRVARVLQGETRAMNLAARYGGDEFISVLTEIRHDGAILQAERVVARIGKDPDLVRYGVTASYGIGEFDPSNMFDGEDLVRAADVNLYGAKVRRSKSSSSS